MFQAYAVQGQHAIPQPDVSAVNIFTRPSPSPLPPIIIAVLSPNVPPSLPAHTVFGSLDLLIHRSFFN